ncbi:MAG: hypothetical protein EOP00_25540 [Pedobacter sp.]|nr:MAG: hypothetical protein EOP00_25540 [Pedobacter sp.]
MKRNLFLLLLVTICTNAAAQQEKFTKFYDEYWKNAPEKDAKYRVDFVKADTLYQTTSYFVTSKKLEGRSTWADTSLKKPRGLSTTYNEDGRLIDSSFYFNTGSAFYRYHFHDNGKLRAYYKGDEKGNEKETKGYDEAGNEIKDFIFEREAEFPGGRESWIKFISNNVKTKVPIKNGAPNGQYAVIVHFIVDKNGSVTNVEAETKKGYGMEEELIRVIQKSPKWKNAVQYNKPVNAYRRQPLTFVVQ